MWNQLSRILKERQMNMNQLSISSGVNKSHFSDLKNGRIKTLSWENMIKIADALNVSLDEFR